MIGINNMKKILSVLLALLMLLSSATVMVSATEAGPTVLDTPEKGGVGTHVFYSQSFDDEALTDKTDYDLIDALGWAEPENDYFNFSIVDGKLHIVSATYDAGGAVLTAPYTTKLISDKNMAGNAITIEYEFSFGTDSRSNAYLSLDVSVDDKNYIRATPLTVGGGVDVSRMIVKNGEAQSILEALNYRLEDLTNGTHKMKCVIDPNSDGVLVSVDGAPMTNLLYDKRASWNNYGRAGSINEVVGDILSLVVMPGLDMTIDNICVSEYAPALQISEIMANGVQSGAYQWLEIYNPTDVATNIYDFCVVIYNGCTSSAGAIGDEKDKPSGTKVRYEKDDDGNIIKITEYTYNAWDDNAASSVGYLRPGSYEMLVKPTATAYRDRYQTFDSPAYEDGMIGPGETAIIMIPYTAVKGGKEVTDEAFREYLTAMGTPANVKTFICENEFSRCGCSEKTYCETIEKCTNPYKYPFRIIDETNESTQVALMRVNNTATEEDIAKGDTYKPVGIGFGMGNAQQYAYYENYVTMCAKPETSGTTVSGFMVQLIKDVVDTNFPIGSTVYEYDGNGKYVLDENGEPKKTVITEPVILKDQKVYSEFFGRAPAQLATTNERSFEICYNRLYNETKAQRMGRMEYNSVEVRPGLGEIEMYYSPGYVTPNCRNGIALETVMPDGTPVTLTARTLCDYEYKGEEPYGYQYVGMRINGEDTVVKTIPGELLTNDTDVSVELVFDRLLPEVEGIQMSEIVDGKYSIRILGKTNHIMCQSLGFRIELSWKNAQGVEEKRSFDRECYYVYDSVSYTDKEGTKNLTAEELGAKKLYAYHLNNLPAAVENLTLTVTPYYVKGTTDQNKQLATDNTATFLINDVPVYDVGDYETDRDNVGFEYDNTDPNPPAPEPTPDPTPES